VRQVFGNEQRQPGGRPGPLWAFRAGTRAEAGHGSSNAGVAPRNHPTQCQDPVSRDRRRKLQRPARGGPAITFTKACAASTARSSLLTASRCRATASPNLGGIRVGTDRRYGAARTTTNAVSVQSAMSALLSSATGRGCNQQVCTDSPLEGDGFELSVPRHESRGFLEHPQRSSQQTLRWRERDACHGQDFKTSLTAYKGRLRRAAFWLFGRIVIKKLHRSQELVMPLS